MAGALAAFGKVRRLAPLCRPAVATVATALALGALGTACATGPGRGRPATGPASPSGPRLPPAVVARCSTTPDGTDALSVAEAAALWPWCRSVLPMTLSTDGWQAEDRWARAETPAAGAAATAARFVEPRSSPVVVSVAVAVPYSASSHQVLVTLFPVVGAGTWGVDGVAVTS